MLLPHVRFSGRGGVIRRGFRPAWRGKRHTPRWLEKRRGFPVETGRCGIITRDIPQRYLLAGALGDTVNVNRRLARDAQFGISAGSTLRHLRVPPMLSDGDDRPTARNTRSVIIPYLSRHTALNLLTKTMLTTSEIQTEQIHVHTELRCAGSSQVSNTSGAYREGLFARHHRVRIETSSIVCASQPRLYPMEAFFSSNGQFARQRESSIVYCGQPKPTLPSQVAPASALTTSPCPTAGQIFLKRARSF